ncbi:MAG: hypothetical protein Q8Q46_02035 [Candidatus Giovannonibacteria bacterium]|nr:hypothetical protein [Candidatus Giovannonibacteria bacterium]
MEFQFNKFTEIGARFSYTISLNKAGGFSFNAGFYRKESLSQYSFVTIFYDKEKKAVGFSFGKDRKEGAFKITHSGSKTASVAPHSFIRAYGIDPVKFAGKYTPEKLTDNQHGKIIYIKLSEKNLENNTPSE